MNKTASKLPIQQMIANVLSESLVKTAKEEETKEKVKKLVSYEKKEHGHIPSPAEEEAEHEKTASSRYIDPMYIEKLASSLEFVASNFHTIELPSSALQKAAQEASPQGPGKGPGALELHTSIGGTQEYRKNHPRTEDAAASQADSPLHAARPGTSKTQLHNTIDNAPGQNSGSVPHAKYPAKGPLTTGQHKEASMSPLRRAVLAKLAGEDVMKATISASRTSDPWPGGSELTVTDSTQSSPHQAGDHGSGFGNQARRLIASNQAVINATKRDAKGPVKNQLHEVLEEPALNAGTDSKLQENLRNTGKAGVKIAAARAVLEKVAAQGCTCETIDRECSFCTLKQKVAAVTKGRGSAKTANAMMGYGGGAGGGMGGSMMPPQSSGMGGMGGGGMMSMADAGAGADGCTCAGIGECKVCKLKAALAAAKAGGMEGVGPVGMAGGAPVEKDSMGAAPGGGIY